MTSIGLVSQCTASAVSFWSEESEAALQVNFLPEAPTQVEAILSASAMSIHFRISCCSFLRVVHFDIFQHQCVQYRFLQFVSFSQLQLLSFPWHCEAVPPPTKKAKVAHTSGAPQLIFSVCPPAQKAMPQTAQLFGA